MIKVEVTHLKAPWPAGTSVGAVVALAVAILPGWAAGKCVVLSATDEREPVAVWEPPAAPAEPEFVVNPAAEAEMKAAELAALLQDTRQALSTARAEIASLMAERDKALADLAAATAAPKAGKAPKA